MSSLKQKIKDLVNKRKRQQNQASGTRAATSATSPQAPAPAAQPSSSQPPPIGIQSKAVADVQAATTDGTLQIALVNQSNSDQLYAYITGQAIDSNYGLFLLQSDARTPYFPASPGTTGAGIGADIAIPLGAPGNTVTATIPRIAGGRIWFSQGAKLVFALNPGPGLVEPSIFNPADPNHNINFGFCEFTYNAFQVFVNISYVDFVSNIPIALTLMDTNNNTQRILGMRADGLSTVARGLRDQTAKDGQAWSSLIVQSNGQDLRVLSPNSGITINNGYFQNYFNDYVNQVYSQHTNQPLIVNTQAGFGNVNGQVNGDGVMDFGNGSTFPKPTAADIFSSNSGPFATGSNAETNTIIPRLAAAFNRSTLLLSNETPNGTNASQYYKDPVTNHYARIVHDANIDGLGYTHPYDDVVPDGGASQAGVVSSGNPRVLTVTVGGNQAGDSKGGCVIL